MDITKLTFVLFTVFSSLRVVSYLPQIRKVASDRNGATAISYSTWSLWTGANVATALYAAVNLEDVYLAIVSSTYAVCCLVVILLTVSKRRQVVARQRDHDADAFAAGVQRAATVETIEQTVVDAAAALAADRRPHHLFERDLAASALRLVWQDVSCAVRRMADK